MQTYIDYNLTFATHPVKKDLFLNLDARAISKSIQNIINTSHYEKVFLSGFGSNIKALLFSMNDVQSASLAKLELSTVLERWEPRIKISDIVVEYDPDSYILSAVIVYSLLNNPAALYNTQIKFEVT